MVFSKLFGVSTFPDLPNANNYSLGTYAYSTNTEAWIVSVRLSSKQQHLCTWNQVLDITKLPKEIKAMALLLCIPV